MTETKPRAEQIRFNSSKTGEHTLDDYIESAERPSQTIGSLLDQIFDVDGYIKTDLFEFRIKDAGGGNYTLQYRSGSYVDPEANWADISQAVFDQILDAAELAKTQAQTAATTATTQAATATTQAATATTQAGIATTQAGIATTQANAAIAAAAGMKRKAPVRAATTAALPSCTYANGSSGVGATLTATANGALPAQDTVTLLVGEGLLVKNQASAQHNGLYVVTQVGSGGTPWILTRQTDSDTWSEIVAAVVTVMEGSAGNADIDYLCTSNNGGTMGTTAITWQAYNATIADGAVSTTAKIANSIITYAKMASSVFATTADLIALTVDKIATAASIGPLYYGCSCTQTTTTTVPNNGLEIILFDGTDEYDDDNWHNPLSNSSRITVNFTGRVEIVVNVGFASTGNGRHDVYIYKNGASYSVLSVNVNAGPCYLSLTDHVPCAPGDYFQAAVLQSTGASRLTDTSLTKFKVRRIK